MIWIHPHAKGGASIFFLAYSPVGQGANTMTEETQTPEEVALAEYNKRYNNRTYLDMIEALETSEHAGNNMFVIANKVTDVALYLCGHPNYTPFVWHELVVMSMAMTAKEIRTVLKHLENFHDERWAAEIPF